MNNSMANSDIIANKIVLRSVNGKTSKYYIQPCPDPRTGRFPDCVKQVDSHGDIRLTEAEKQEDGITKHFVKITDVIVVEDGKTFNLNDIYDAAEWEAIKNSILIAPSRDAKDAQGNLLIDGTANMKQLGPMNERVSFKYGNAELYVDRPGLITQTRVSRKKKLHDAFGYIMDDERGYEGRLLKAKLLGRIMKGQPDSDVEDYLFQVAEKDPDKIINLYTGDDIQLRLLFIDAKDKHVITFKNKAYCFGENIIAATDEAVITWMKLPRNKGVIELIKREVYPELFMNEDLNQSESSPKSSKK